MRIRLAGLAPVVLALAVVSACGARTGLLVDDQGPSADASAEADACVDGVDIPVVGDQPNLYFVLDRSASMSREGKWAAVQNTVTRLVSRLGTRARFGAAVYPGDEACQAGGQVFPLQRGGEAVAQSLLSVLQALPATGGTPTAQTIEAVRPLLPAKDTFLILATDGGPNCNPDLTCNSDRCVLNIEATGSCRPNALPNCCAGGTNQRRNCLDDARARQAIASVRDSGIPTFVIGVATNPAYVSVLDDMAVAGGTARAATPRHYRVDSADESALSAALLDIAARITATCKLKLERPPRDPGDELRVILDGVEVPPGGFAMTGNEVTLFGAWCDRYRADVPPVVVRESCPGQERRRDAGADARADADADAASRDATLDR